MNLVSNPKVELRGRVKAKILPAVHRKIWPYIQIDVRWRRKHGMEGWDGKSWMDVSREVGR